MPESTPAASRQWLIERKLASGEELDLLSRAQRLEDLNAMCRQLWDRMSAAVRNGRRDEAALQGWDTGDVHRHLNVIADGAARRLGPPAGTGEALIIL